MEILRLVTAKKDEKVFVGIVDEEEEKVLHVREAQRQKGEKVTIPITMLECIERGTECVEKCVILSIGRRKMKEPRITR